ncbi:MAG: UDP-N-acetylmuramoyl-L-alanyl-D-glutamate--2,6-diaminopimelate ligase [Bacillota bacterium]|nr:UDP-N-acetylmuramoyl-L-alanyl-D-glutamate--2,6-diaminopimelate ligase [Bacillota bacterium]
MRLAELISVLGVLEAGGDLNIEATGLACDSRQVAPGHVFVAVPGHATDGHLFIPQALERGAAALVVERVEPEWAAKAAWARVPDARRALAAAAAFFYGYPARSLRLTGVTGTNGKTTTTHLTRAVYRQAGLATGLIGTIHTLVGDTVLPAERTTPESLDLQRLWRRMVDSGVTHVVMEVSSHALRLGRVAPADFTAAVFTNLTQDHLDFHRDMEDYFAAKALLFTGLPPGGLAVINADDPWGRRLAEMCGERAVTYGVEGGTVRAGGVAVEARGASFRVASPWGGFPLRLKLTGLFNVYNALAAAAAGLAQGIEADAVRAGLEAVSGVAGRFERVDGGQDFTVIIDYAHTPDGLENVLRAARRVTEGRVISVFGCGGDRDQGKRPLMGRISGELADFTIVTSDNPRTEDPLAIIAAIEAGTRAVTARYSIVPDRREAIRAALEMARSGDIVLIAGKGHEDYQIIGMTKCPFDDRLVVREALAEMGYVENNA